MNLDSILEKRHSVRDYTDLVPSNREMEKVVGAAMSAPSAGDLKARKVFTYRKGSRRGLDESLHQEWAKNAPYLLVFCADLKAAEPFGDRGRELYCVQDATISAAFAMLKATEIGLGTCWIGSFDEKKVKEEAGLPSQTRPVAILAAGYEK